MYATEKRGYIVDTGHFDICTDSTVATVKHVIEKTNKKIQELWVLHSTQ
jgi:hypothetical protein